MGAIVGAVAGPIIGGLIGGGGGPSGSTSPGGAAGAADPFAAQRGQYQNLLNNMMTGGGFTPQDPSYQWRFNQGLTGTQRAMASSGMAGSGNEMAALTQYGQNMASQEYANQFSRLSQLAGANVGSPAAAGQILAGAGQQQQAGANALGGIIGNAVSNNWSNWFAPSPSSSPSLSSGSVSSIGSGQTFNFGQPSPSTNAWGGAITW